ncbi:MAG: hypothetical protein A2X04_15690 [Bacteroidetes bacterium GWF2_41_9]|nr:MAG: hypothetical protein US80_C0004G0025 [Candidatus Daviesbacteria bacterium GW2011_GWA2_38_17]OFY59072.1 MAG: hypothetical protein A2X04_15690 [Bacteroidetes bacterium GWF2_41_9]OGE44033.1 MAG: hypothetical protein A3E67_01250 [Candidatus Daviesbacteria bacterium RIFCSPHIGHO2_12_FULL_38_25]OGE67241.1 MAG: hypothetical protein A3H81_05590 [Candidatus Daviesbacteria bacterium RIFCSPLOWO2_02_FULL_38_18]OGE71786.1 MAG: hypothetical protein A3H18_05055 [Candidatus Daviesbacteria bacterium RIFC
MTKTLTKLAHALIVSYDRDLFAKQDKTISVNPLVAELATWYEKFRTAMDYRDDEVILRSTIERILKRRLILGGNGQSIAAPLIRELIWARYFPDSSVPEAVVAHVASAIDLFFKLESEINRKHRINRASVNEWIMQLLSSEIEDILKPSPQKNTMCNFIYQLFRKRITISDDSEETRDIQTFIAVRRAFANDDLALLRFHLFKQYFGKITAHNLDEVSGNFPKAQKELSGQLRYPAKDKIYSYIKNQTVPFVILDDVLRNNQSKITSLISETEQLDLSILEACNSRYKSISGKVKRAIVRSVIFIFFTKAIFALSIEGTYERIVYDKIMWSSIALNTLTPPILMILVGMFIKTPSRENSFRIVNKINSILYDDDPDLGQSIVVRKTPKKTDPIMALLFTFLWLTTFVLSFGAIIFVLNKFKVNPLSQGVFVFFLAIVSFISYRINRTANSFQFKDHRDSISSLFFDFFFMPFIQVGRRLTTAISQINIVLFIFDFIIETPFKGIFAFFEQWFLFLRTQREKLE